MWLTALKAIAGLLGLGDVIARWFEKREIKKAAVTEERLERAAEVIEAAEERREVEDEIHRLPDSDVRDRLRGRWSSGGDV